MGVSRKDIRPVRRLTRDREVAMLKVQMSERNGIYEKEHEKAQGGLCRLAAGE